MSCPRWDIIDDKLLYEAWASDQDMYPASELTYDRLKSLNDACPELSICLRGTQREAQTGATGDKTSNTLNVSEPDASVTHGLIIVWPLRADMYWKQLLDHTIEEHDVEAAMFPPFCGGVVGEKIPVGLHIFHIERFSAFERPRKGVGFTTMALEEVRQRIAKLERTKAWCIVGYSGEKWRTKSLRYPEQS